MEPKRGCCMQNYRPVSPQRELCAVRKCNYNSKQQNDQLSNNQKLLHRIQHIKKNLERFQNPNRSREGEGRNQRDGESQTPDFTRSDLNSFRQILNNCIIQMKKLKKFVEDENFWWKVFKDKDFNCCEQNMPHLHGFLDGTMVTLKILEERLGEPIAHSTPERRRSDPLLPCQEHLIRPPYAPREDERKRLEECMPVEHTRRTSPRMQPRVIEEREQIDYSPERAPRTPIRSPRIIERTRIDEPVFIDAPRVPVTEQRELQFYSLPEYEESFPRGHTISYQVSNGSRVERTPRQVADPVISPRIVEQMVEPRNQRIIEERRNNRYRTGPEISIMQNGHETFHTTIPTVGTTHLGLWHTKSASDFSPSQTFNTENTARKQIILSDISTSVEFHPVQEMSQYSSRQEKRFMIKENKNNQNKNQCEILQERKEKTCQGDIA
ncbi:uncharacterized protein LOC102673654 [Apis dorsata]|uniref:uncharacterized protein LOC102673654 n=1 Tax=Apis dorsata TaxID=7462 RepID=UPI00129352F4|nr:uncharacterized protein LOC102673654 [Apis dorsata]